MGRVCRTHGISDCIYYFLQKTCRGRRFEDLTELTVTIAVFVFRKKADVPEEHVACIFWVRQADTWRRYIAPKRQCTSAGLHGIARIRMFSARLSLVLLLDPEDGYDMLLRNVGLFPNYTTIQPKRPALFCRAEETQETKTCVTED